MTLEESREVIPLMENMIKQIEEQQELIKGTFLRSLLIFYLRGVCFFSKVDGWILLKLEDILQVNESPWG